MLLERAVIVTRGTSIRIRELPPEVREMTREGSPSDSLDLHAQERLLIERALQRFEGNRQQAAEALKISAVTQWRKMKRYGLDA
jgi:transcriptional regulator of acetoin/glycerol metabolism